MVASTASLATTTPFSLMSPPSAAPDPVRLTEVILSRIQHLDLTGETISRSEKATGHGGFSDVFKGRCQKEGMGELDVAIKRLRFHVDNIEFTKVSLPSFLSGIDADACTSAI